MSRFLIRESNLAATFTRNLASNIFLFCLRISVGVWLTPYLISKLGVALYGLVPLVWSITEYFGLIIYPYYGAISRYLTIALRSEDAEKANQTFNATLFGGVGLVILLLPAAGLVYTFLPDFMSVPAGQEDQFGLLLGLILVTFLIGCFAGYFTTSAFAVNRLDLANLTWASEIVFRVLLILAFFHFVGRQIIYVGYAHILAALVAFSLAVYIWRKLTPQLSISPRSIKFSLMRQISGTSGWMIIDQAGAVLFLNIDLILINKLFGAEAGGGYAPLVQWALMFRILAQVLADALSPLTYSYYAKRELDTIAVLVHRAVKFIGLTLALPIGLVCGSASFMLAVWLGQGFSGSGPLLWIVVGHLSLNLAITPLFAIQTAANKVRTPGIVTFCLGWCNVALAIALATWAGWGPYGVAASGAIVFTSRTLLFTSWYAARIVGRQEWYFLRATLPGLIAASLTAVAAYFLTRLVNPTGWLSLISCYTALGLAYVGAVLSCLDRSDREWLFSRLKSALGGRG